MNKNKKDGKNPSLLVSQPVKWMNLKNSQLSVRTYKVVFVSSDTFSSKYRYETRTQIRLLYPTRWTSDYRNKQLAALLNS